MERRRSNNLGRSVKVPELPEVEQMARLVRLIAVNAGRCKLDIYDKRLEALSGDLGIFLTATRRGKELLLSFSEAKVSIHPRMTGRLEPLPTKTNGRAGFSFENGDGFVFVDQRCLGQLELGEFSPRDLGPEPWEEGAAPKDSLWYRQAFGKFSGSVKSALMNQRLIAGLGNIAAIESLWRAGIDPRTPTQSLTDDQLNELADGVYRYIERTITSEDPLQMKYVNEGGDNPFMIYGRVGEGCPACGDVISSFKLAGRGTAWCASCQL